MFSNYFHNNICINNFILNLYLNILPRPHYNLFFAKVTVDSCEISIPVHHYKIIRQSVVGGQTVKLRDA